MITRSHLFGYLVYIPRNMINHVTNHGVAAILFFYMVDIFINFSTITTVV